MAQVSGHQTAGAVDDRPLLLFFSSRRSGPARRMSSLVAWRGVSRKRVLRVVEVDVDEHPDLATDLRVDDVPALVLVDGSRIVGRLEGRATGPEIDRFLASVLTGDPSAA